MDGNISNFLSEKNIVMNLGASTKEEAISKLTKVLKTNGYIDEASEFEKDVLDRESMTTTGIGNELAIPHGKSDHVIETTMMFAKNDKGIEWNSLDGSKVKDIFLMAVSKADQGDEHLRMLAQLSGKLMDDEFVDAIKNAKTSDEVLKILNDAED